MFRVSRPTRRVAGDPLRREPPQSVLHFGLFPTSKNVQGLLELQNVVHVDTRPGLRLPIDGNVDLPSLTSISVERGEVSERNQSEAMAQRWFDTDRRISKVLEKLPRENLFEPNVARALFESMNDGALLVVAKSMPIRQTDVWLGYGTRGRLHLSCAGCLWNRWHHLGCARKHPRTGEPVWVFLGDLAFLHDVRALALVKELNAPVKLVVSDNRGGGIFFAGCRLQNILTL